MGWRERYQQASGGPGNQVSRFFRGLLHASSPSDFPLDSRNTLNWRGSDQMGGRNSVAGAAIRGAVDPTGMIWQAPDDSRDGFRPQQSTRAIPAPWMTGQQQGGRQGSVVAQGYVGTGTSMRAMTSPKPSEIGPQRPRPSASLPQADNPIVRNDPEVNGRMGVDSFDGISSGRGGPTLGNSGYTARGGRGGTVSRQHNLGAGALGSGGDAAMQDGFTALHNRRGLLAEF